LNRTQTGPRQARAVGLGELITGDETGLDIPCLSEKNTIIA